MRSNDGYAFEEEDCPCCGGDTSCPDCGGSGEDSVLNGFHCATCNGTGNCPECAG